MLSRAKKEKRRGGEGGDKGKKGGEEGRGCLGCRYFHQDPSDLFRSQYQIIELCEIVIEAHFELTSDCLFW